MAAKKSIPTKPAPHQSQAKEPRRPPAPGRGLRESAKDAGPGSDYEPAAKLALRLRSPDDVVECLSKALALVETIGLALREYESHEDVGSICMAFEQAVEQLGRAHSAVNLYLQRTRP